ncbi:two pore calcium channel protein 2-like [Salmo trutta]|uniref:two pore calcium channel protein 2-like n=1 Tax=Salmo trutta TaxID=8032 RepID=UPI001130BFBA|nr:two pore calcium channel protein 2-like [Salmo trutta]
MVQTVLKVMRRVQMKGYYRDAIMKTINCFFILYYLLEMELKVVAFGWTGYVSYGSNVFDGSLTVLSLMSIQTSILRRSLGVKAAFELLRCQSQEPTFSEDDTLIPDHGGLTSLWEMVRLVNILSVFHFHRHIPLKLMALFASSMVDLVKSLRASSGILVVVYYVFAVLGVWLFKGSIIAPASNLSTTPDPRIMTMTVNKTLHCGSDEQLGSRSNNFDDFASALVLLYNIMMNNLNVFLDLYARYTTELSKLYFIAWWLTSSVMWVNLFIALILDVGPVHCLFICLFYNVITPVFYLKVLKLPYRFCCC